MAALDNFDRIAAFQVAIWSIYLLGGIYLCVRHGFARSSGWAFLVILSLIRIIGSSMRLATINDPENSNLYIGWAVCSGIGLSMLIAVSIGLMSRLLTSVRRAKGGHTLITPLIQRLMKSLAMVAVILFIVGGTQATWKTTSGGQPNVKYPTLSKVGVGLMIALLVYSLIEAIYLMTLRRYIPDGEKRILLAVWLAFPFVTVRLAYSATIVYSDHSPSPWFTLGLEVIMEVIAAAIFEIVGFTLQKETKDVTPEMQRIQDPEQQQEQHGHKKNRNGESMSGHRGEGMSGGMGGHMGEGMSGRLSGRLSDRMSDRMNGRMRGRRHGRRPHGLIGLIGSFL